MPSAGLDLWQQRDMTLTWGRADSGLASPGGAGPGGRGHQLSLDERMTIMRGRDAGLSYAEIARQVGRDEAVVWREVHRNRSGEGDHMPLAVLQITPRHISARQLRLLLRRPSAGRASHDPNHEKQVKRTRNRNQYSTIDQCGQICRPHVLTLPYDQPDDVAVLPVITCTSPYASKDAQCQCRDAKRHMRSPVLQPRVLRLFERRPDKEVRVAHITE